MERRCERSVGRRRRRAARVGWGLVLGAGLVLAVGWVATRVLVAVTERAYPPVGSFVRAGGVDVHYLRGGSGPTVVLLHGRDGTLQEFTLSVFDELTKHYEVIAFDRPGYGYSERPTGEPLSLGVQARLLREALHALAVEQPILVGHSYGGAVMLRFLMDHPDDAIGAVSLAGAAYVDAPPRGGLLALPNAPVVGPLLTHTLVTPLAPLVAQGIYRDAFAPAEAPSGYVETIVSLYARPSQLSASAAELAVMYDSAQAAAAHYASIETPLVVLFGSDDRVLDVDRDGRDLAAAVPGAELMLVPDAGHKLHHTHPEQLLRALARVIERADGADAP